jgi:hypothetical protein
MKKLAFLLFSLFIIQNQVDSQSMYDPSKTDGSIIKILNSSGKPYFNPLQEIILKVSFPASLIKVRDGRGTIYFTAAALNNLTFRAGGALGLHSVQAFDDSGKLVDEAFFNLNAQTGIDDKGGKYHNFLNSLYWTMVGESGETEIWRVNNKFYYTFVRWLRDHVHTLKGMKYFYPELKSGIDLYANTQRADGMIWDNIYPRSGEKNWWNRRFDYGNFIEEIEGGKYEMKRIPIENDVEYLFLEGLYYTWKATGDDSWMASHLDQALKAVKYSTHDSYRWSEKYQLLKRGYTIDTWDFQSNEDAALVDGNDIMRIELGKTRFGIMYGDNTGMAMGCRYLSEMLNHAGRTRESAEIKDLGKQIQARIDQLSWNGNFYTHQVSEDPSVKRDLGVDPLKQVSLSNAYSINRDITHQQAVAIIKTYQDIRKNMPSSSPGEWYTIFPPFEKGYGDNDASKKWQYMNGGVTPIVAGELAHGAFDNGYEKYGIDILDRLMGLASKTGNYLHCTYAGKMPDKPSRSFKVVDINPYVNAIYPAKGAEFNGKSISSWDMQDNSGNKIFKDIPIKIIDPAENKYTAIELSGQPGQLSNVIIPVNQKISAVYLLHGTQRTGLVGSVTINYEDKTEFVEYIDEQKIGFWWDHPDESQPKDENTIKAWRSNNAFYEAAYIHGINNPFPEKSVISIGLSAMKNGLNWDVMGLTLSDYPVFFEPSIISWGIPDNWGAAAVVYSLIEGLAGIKDKGVAFDKLYLSPKWSYTQVENVSVTAKYEASGGYSAYQYAYDSLDASITVIYTGNGEKTEFRLLLPKGKLIRELTLNGKPAEFNTMTIEKSNYAALNTDSTGVYEVKVHLK